MVTELRGSTIGKNFTEISEGGVFLGKDAIQLGLVDRLITSDEYIGEKIRNGDRVLRLHKYDKRKHGIMLSPADLLLRQGFVKRFSSERLFRIMAKISSEAMPVVRIGGTLTIFNYLNSFLRPSWYKGQHRKIHPLQIFQ